MVYQASHILILRKDRIEIVDIYIIYTHHLACLRFIDRIRSEPELNSFFNI